MLDYLTKAIKFLHPEAQFSFTNNDYSTIKWDILNGNPPTEEEINAAIEQIKIKEETEIGTKAAQRQALLDKLGITEEEARLLLGGN